MECFTYLNDGLFTLDFKDLTLSLGAIAESDLDNLCVLGELNIVEDNKWTFDVDNSTVIHSWINDVVSDNCIRVSLEVL